MSIHTTCSVGGAIRKADIKTLEKMLSDEQEYSVKISAWDVNELSGFRFCINTAIYHGQLEVAKWLHEQWLASRANRRTFGFIPICSVWALRYALDDGSDDAIQWLTKNRQECLPTTETDYKSLVNFVIPFVEQVGGGPRMWDDPKWSRDVSVEATQENLEYILNTGVFPNEVPTLIRDTMKTLIYGAHAKLLSHSAKKLFSSHMKSQKKLDNMKVRVALECPGVNFYKESSEAKRIHIE